MKRKPTPSNGLHIACTACGGSGVVPDPIKFGAHLRQLRQKKGLSLAAAAAEVDISAQYLCDLELGRRSFGFPAAKALADRLQEVLK